MIPIFPCDSGDQGPTSSVCAAQKGWSGARSNRRPSANEHLPASRDVAIEKGLAALAAARDGLGNPSRVPDPRAVQGADR